MKTKQEQIEEMARCMGEKNFLCADDCENCIQIPCKCKLLKQSKLLYKAGYRKASDVVDEFVKRLIQRVTENNTDEGYLDESIDYTCLMDDIKELAAEMKQEVEK